MLWLVFFPVTVILGWYLLIKPFSYWKEKGVAQTNPWLIFGDLWPQVFRRKSQNEWIEWLYNQYPGKRYFGFYWFYQPVLAVRDPELIKQLGVKDFEHFTDHRNFVDNTNEPLFGRSLFSLKGQPWRDMRSALSGSFTSSKMKYMFSTIADASTNFKKYIDDKNEVIVELEMKDTYRQFATDVIANTAFGIQVDSFKNPRNDFFLMGKELFNFDGVRMVKFFLRFLMPWLFKIFPICIFPKHVADYFQKIINETIDLREKNGIVRPDMINLLLEMKHGVKHSEEKVEVDTGYATVEELLDQKSGKKPKLTDITNEYIASQALLFFLAGFDTVATGMSFGTYELACNLDVQKKLREEIKETLAKCDGHITYDALLKMKYMDMVVSEMLRKWHPAGAMDRVCTKPYTIEPTQPGEKPININTGDVLWYPYYAIQRDSKYWPEPEKFDPERFSDENKDKIQPYTYFPFGVGPRNCIGSRFALLELKCMLFHILQTYEFVPTAKTMIPLLLDKTNITNTAKGGFWLGIRRVVE